MRDPGGDAESLFLCFIGSSAPRPDAGPPRGVGGALSRRSSLFRYDPKPLAGPPWAVTKPARNPGRSELEFCLGGHGHGHGHGHGSLVQVGMASMSAGTGPGPWSRLGPARPGPRPHRQRDGRVHGDHIELGACRPSMTGLRFRCAPGPHGARFNGHGGKRQNLKYRYRSL